MPSYGLGSRSRMETEYVKRGFSKFNWCLETKQTKSKMMTNVKENKSTSDFKGRKLTYSSSSSQGANVIMIEQSLAVIATLY